MSCMCQVMCRSPTDHQSALLFEVSDCILAEPEIFEDLHWGEDPREALMRDLWTSMDSCKSHVHVSTWYALFLQLHILKPPGADGPVPAPCDTLPCESRRPSQRITGLSSWSFVSSLVIDDWTHIAHIALCNTGWKAFYLASSFLSRCTSQRSVRGSRS